MDSRSLRPSSLTILAAILIAGCTHGMSPMHHGEGMHHRFEDPEKWAARFDDPGRDAWQKPDEVVKALALKADARVADVGAATGYFAVRLARAVPAGKVYGVDLEPSMVAYLDQRARKESLANLVGVQGSVASPNIPAWVDLVLIVDTYHHLEDRPGYFRRLAERLAVGGRVAIIDFRRGQPMGPPDSEKIPAEQVETELRESGYVLVATHDFLPNQHFLVFALATP